MAAMRSTASCESQIPTPSTAIILGKGLRGGSDPAWGWQSPTSSVLTTSSRECSIRLGTALAGAPTLDSRPSRTCLLFEEFQDFGEPYGYETTNQGSALNDGWSGFFVFTDWVTLRHNRKCNLLFWDGHVQLIDGGKFNHYETTFGAWTVVGGTRNFTAP